MAMAASGIALLGAAMVSPNSSGEDTASRADLLCGRKGEGGLELMIKLCRGAAITKLGIELRAENFRVGRQTDQRTTTTSSPFTRFSSMA